MYILHVCVVRNSLRLGWFSFAEIYNEINKHLRGEEKRNVEQGHHALGGCFGENIEGIPHHEKPVVKPFAVIAMVAEQGPQHHRDNDDQITIPCSETIGLRLIH